MTFIKHAANTSYRALASVSVGFGTVSARVPTGAIGLITGLIGLKSRTKKAVIGVILSAGALIMGLVLILCLAIKVGLTPHNIR